MPEYIERTLSGRRLTTVAAVLIAAAFAGSAAVALRGEIRMPARAAEETGPSPDVLIARAAGEEAMGNVAAALSLYRQAVARRPGIVDRRSPDFLGNGFETKVRGWVRDLKGRRAGEDPKALDDASYLFRRMYGGCG